jgi:hypothetical protein
VLATAIMGTPSVTSDRPPTLGGSVASGVGAALSVGFASTDAWSPSPPVVQGGATKMLVSVGARPGMVWLVFLFFFFFFFCFFFFFFFFFFSSLFSSVPLERKEGREVRKKISKFFKAVQVVLTRRHTQTSPSCRGL